MRNNAVWRRPLLLCAILAFGLHALRAFVFGPLNVSVNANIVYATSLLPIALDMLVDLLLMAVIYISYTFILETIFREGFRRALPLMLIYLGAAVFGAAGNLVMDITVGGAAEEIIGMLLMATIGGIGQELEQLVWVVICACLLAWRYCGAYVPEGLFSRRNRLQLAALVSAGITALFQIRARLIYDIDLGMPSSTLQVLDMVTGYGSDLLIPFLGYLGMVLLMMRHSDQAAEPTAGA